MPYVIVKLALFPVLPVLFEIGDQQKNRNGHDEEHEKDINRENIRTENLCQPAKERGHQHDTDVRYGKLRADDRLGKLFSKALGCQMEHIRNQRTVAKTDKEQGNARSHGRQRQEQKHKGKDNNSKIIKGHDLCGHVYVKVFGVDQKRAAPVAAGELNGVGPQENKPGKDNGRRFHKLKKSRELFFFVRMAERVGVIISGMDLFPQRKGDKRQDRNTDQYIEHQAVPRVPVAVI